MRPFPFRRLLVAGALLAIAWPLAAQQALNELTVTSSGLPLKPERFARFTTTKGTWMSIDVSPDGQTLVFDLVGDIYTMPAAGGKATRITNGIAHDMQPRFSPDGRRVVFVSDRSGDENVWLVNKDGTGLAPLTKGEENIYTSPEWTPDGQYIVVRVPVSRSYTPIWYCGKIALYVQEPCRCANQT